MGPKEKIPFAWPKASLRAYLVAVILLATVPMAALLVPYQIFNDLSEQQQRQQDDLRMAAASFAATVDREIASTIDALDILSTAQSIDPGDGAAIAHGLFAHSRLRRSWSGAFLASTDGRALYSTPPVDDTSSAELLRTVAARGAAQSREPFVSDLVPGGAGRHLTAVAVPLVIGGDAPYLLGAWIDSAVWQNLLAEGVVPVGGSVGLFDRQNRYVAGTPHSQPSIGRALPASVVVAKSRRPAGEVQTELFDGSAGYLAWDRVARAGWGVTVSLPLEPLADARQRAIVGPLASAAGCLLVGVLLALYVARRVTVPLHELATQGISSSRGRIPVREIALLQDALLTARQQDEQARALLQKKADEFETLFDSSPIGLAFAEDSQCRTVLRNAAMDASFGSSAEAGAGVRVLHAGEQLEPGQQPLQRAAAHGETTRSLELEVISDRDPPKFVLASAAPLLDSSGRPRGAIGAVVDITDRKTSEARLLSIDARLRESQRLVDLAQQAGHVGFFYYHFEQDVLGWTPGQAQLFGIEVGHEEGPSLDAWAERIESATRAEIEAVLNRMLDARDKAVTLEFRVTLPDGRSRWLSNRLVMHYDDAGQPVQLVGITVDMSDQKQAELERDLLIEREQAARLQAEDANRAKDEFLAMLGHELRNPLSAISSAVEVLNRVDDDAEIALNARSIIGRQTRNLAHLMDDLLDVARVISGKILLSRRPLDLALLVDRLMATMQVTGATAAHRVYVEASEAWLDGDATRVEQVVNNLVTNAIKYTPAGGRIDVSVRRIEGDVWLEVKDAGVGIPGALLPRIFDLFVQGERTLDRRAGGLGIGLTLVRRLVELHDGSVSAESSASGSVFRVRFPAAEAPPREEHGAMRRTSKRRSVAVLEDNHDALLALQSILELMGHRVTTAEDGRDGLQLLLETRPDVAVVDIGLPGMTGLQVAKQSRSAGYAGRMIAVSGYGQAADVREAMVAGFDAYLIKPVDSTELERLMENE